MTELADNTLVGLLDAAPDAMVVVDEQGVIVLFNEQAERLFGYARADLVGQRIEVLVPEHARAVHPAHRHRYMSDPAPRPMGASIQLAGRRCDGSEFPAEISLSAIRTEAGMLVSASIRDASDRRRAEAQFRGLLEAAPDAMVCVRANGVIALVNARAEELFDYPRRDLIGQNIDMLIPEGARAKHPGHRRDYFADPRPRPMAASMQLAGRRRDASEFPAEISLSAIETDEGLLVSATIRDVTERLEALKERERLKAQADSERLERQLHQSQRMESLGQLAGGVAHDFNNLLAVILNYASFVGEELTGAVDAPDGGKWVQPLKDVEQIQEAAKRAGLLTHQLLAFARREVVQPRILNLNTAIRRMEQILRRTIGEQIQLEINLTDGLPAVKADPGQVEQIVLNLAINARDAMPSGGVLSIDTSTTTIDHQETDTDPTPGVYVRCRVGDTGVGMTREVRDRAFEPFYTTKPKGEGSGLGLATVYGIVSQSSGFTRLYSEPGFGTTVTVLLPAAGGTGEDYDEATGKSDRLGGSETILVVEDEDTIREVTSRILTRNGYRVLAACGGDAAIAIAQEYPGSIELVLTDVIMPKMQGKAVADEVTRLRPDIQVLFMSGYAQPVLGVDAHLGAEFSLVEKPFNEMTLLTKLRELLDRAK